MQWKYEVYQLNNAQGIYVTHYYWNIRCILGDSFSRGLSTYCVSDTDDDSGNETQALEFSLINSYNLGKVKNKDIYFHLSALQFRCILH